jgi:hypothetical protein
MQAELVGPSLCLLSSVELTTDTSGRDPYHTSLTPDTSSLVPETWY